MAEKTMSVVPIREHSQPHRPIVGVSITLSAVDARRLHDWIHERAAYGVHIEDPDGVPSQLSVRLLAALHG